MKTGICGRPQEQKREYIRMLFICITFVSGE